MREIVVTIHSDPDRRGHVRFSAEWEDPKIPMFDRSDWGKIIGYAPGVRVQIFEGKLEEWIPRFKSRATKRVIVHRLDGCDEIFGCHRIVRRLQQPTEETK